MTVTFVAPFSSMVRWLFTHPPTWNMKQLGTPTLSNSRSILKYPIQSWMVSRYVIWDFGFFNFVVNSRMYFDPFSNTTKLRDTFGSSSNTKPNLRTSVRTRAVLDFHFFFGSSCNFRNTSCKALENKDSFMQENVFSSHLTWRHLLRSAVCRTSVNHIPSLEIEVIDSMKNKFWIHQCQALVVED